MTQRLLELGACQTPHVKHPTKTKEKFLYRSPYLWGLDKNDLSRVAQNPTAPLPTLFLSLPHKRLGKV